SSRPTSSVTAANTCSDGVPRATRIATRFNAACSPASRARAARLGAIADLWGKGSVVRSWLLELAADAFHKDPNLEQITGYVDDNGEGRWTVEQAIELAVPMPVIAASLFARFRSRQPDSFSAKVLAALRNEFGGHAVKEKEE
ncbi:MAG: hypothetical protein ACLQUT_04505, partial [Thermoleophilia bacterium]